MDMGPDLRTQVDYLFALRENIHSNKQKLWKYFFGMFNKYEEFNRVMDKCTENYSALVLDNTCAKSNQVTDCIFWYKADPTLPGFKMGKQLYWNVSRRCQRTGPPEEEPQEESAASPIKTVVRSGAT